MFRVIKSCRARSEILKMVNIDDNGRTAHVFENVFHFYFPNTMSKENMFWQESMNSEL